MAHPAGAGHLVRTLLRSPPGQYLLDLPITQVSHRQLRQNKGWKQADTFVHCNEEAQMAQSSSPCMNEGEEL